MSRLLAGAALAICCAGAGAQEFRFLVQDGSGRDVGWLAFSQSGDERQAQLSITGAPDLGFDFVDDLSQPPGADVVDLQFNAQGLLAFWGIDYSACEPAAGACDFSRAWTLDGNVHQGAATIDDAVGGSRRYGLLAVAEPAPAALLLAGLALGALAARRRRA